jgi:penicillin amidase
MNGATDWESFRDACAYSHIPGENMIWADREGNIGWQVVGIAPIRKNWDGLVPVPGDGRYEWAGFLPIKELPTIYNPEKGFWATANENLVTADYPNRNAVGWSWADSSRANRVNEVLAQPKTHTPEEMMELQFDYYSKPASQLVPLLKNIKGAEPEQQRFIELLLSWNYRMEKNSVPAGLYMAWEKKLLENAYPLFVPEKVNAVVRSVPLRRVIGWIAADAPELNGRNQFLLRCLDDAVAHLLKKLGDDVGYWQYGQESYHHVFIKHPISELAPHSLRGILDCGPLPRGGSSSTPGVTGNSDNQSHGATFRMVADLSDWDRVMFSNAPGQSGDARSPYYKNLFSDWADDKHFPVFFTKFKIEQTAREKIMLVPQSR